MASSSSSGAASSGVASSSTASSPTSSVECCISSGRFSFKPREFPDILLRLDAGRTHPARQIVKAAQEGDIPRMKELAELRRGEGKSVAVVEEIRDPPNSRSLGALHVAAHCGQLKMCEFLIDDLHLDVNAAAQYGSSPLMCAIYGSAQPVVKLLLDRGADPNLASREGFTVLHFLATKKDRLQLAVMLLSRGANVDSMSEEGTPLHLAAQCGNVEMMKVLSCYRANPNRVVQSSFAPLTLALFASSLECVELLIKVGADVNAAGPVTPLIIAARDGLADCIKCLLEARADPNSPDEIGRMPVEIAAVHGWKECVEILFPVTHRVAKFADWSIDGIMQHVKSGSSEGHTRKSVEAGFNAPGDAALEREDYAQASILYTKAIETGIEDPNLYAKRCLCWLEMGEEDKALADAHTCKSLGFFVSIRYHEQGPPIIPTGGYGQASEAQLDSGSVPVGEVSREKDK